MIRRFVLLAAATLACTTIPIEPDHVIEGKQVLFIGNSLTYVNDLPGALADVALAAPTPWENEAAPSATFCGH